MGQLQGEIQKLDSLFRTNKVDREVLTSMLAVTTNRIFTKGLASSERKIAKKYSDQYIKTRSKERGLSGRKVILQFTQQMKNDFSVIVERNLIGLGFKNSFNTEKSHFVEKTYKKDIFEHTKKEEKLIDKLHGKAIERHFK